MKPPLVLNVVKREVYGIANPELSDEEMAARTPKMHLPADIMVRLNRGVASEVELEVLKGVGVEVKVITEEEAAELA